MYHPTLGMPWSKEQAENRWSQVRNQNSSGVSDGTWVLAAAARACVRGRA